MNENCRTNAIQFFPNGLKFGIPEVMLSHRSRDAVPIRRNGESSGVLKELNSLLDVGQRKYGKASETKGVVFDIGELSFERFPAQLNEFILGKLFVPGSLNGRRLKVISHCPQIGKVFCGVIQSRQFGCRLHPCTPSVLQECRGRGSNSNCRNCVRIQRRVRGQSEENNGDGHRFCLCR